MVRQGNGNGEKIKTPLELEKEELRRLIRDFHPDKFMQASPEDRKRVENMIKVLNALSEIHEHKKLISENGWPKGTPPPKEIPLVAVAPDGALIRINSTLNGDAFSPAAYFEKVKEFHKDPAAFLAAVRERNQAQTTQTRSRRTSRTDDWLNDIMRNSREYHERHEAGERTRQSAARAAEQQRAHEEEQRRRRYREDFERAEAARRAAAEEERARREQAQKEAAERAAEARKREEEEFKRTVAEHEQLIKSLGDQFGLRTTKFDPKYFPNDTVASQNEYLKHATTILRQIGPGVSYVRGFSLLIPMNETRVHGNLKRIEINPREDQKITIEKILRGIQEIQHTREAEEKHKNAVNSLKELKPLQVIESQFAKRTPEQIAGFKDRVQSAIDQAEHGWILKSALVHHAAIHLSVVDDMNVRYRLSEADASKTSGVVLEIGIAASQPALVGLMNTVGAEIEKRYPAATLAPHKVPILGEQMEDRLGIRFSGLDSNSKILTPERKLQFLERFRSAYDKIDTKDRVWLSNMTVNPPNEGAQLLGRNVGSRRAWVARNEFHAPFDVSEESILDALQAEIRKKKDA